MCNRRHRHNTTTNTHTSAHSEDVALRFKLPFFHIHSVTLVSYRSIPNSISSICEWFFVVVVLRRLIVRSLYILVFVAQIFRFHAVVVVVCFFHVRSFIPKIHWVLRSLRERNQHQITCVPFLETGIVFFYPLLLN